MSTIDRPARWSPTIAIVVVTASLMVTGRAAAAPVFGAPVTVSPDKRAPVAVCADPTGMAVAWSAGPSVKLDRGTPRGKLGVTSILHLHFTPTALAVACSPRGAAVMWSYSGSAGVRTGVATVRGRGGLVYAGSLPAVIPQIVALGSRYVISDQADSADGADRYTIVDRRIGPSIVLKAAAGKLVTLASRADGTATLSWQIAGFTGSYAFATLTPGAARAGVATRIALPPYPLRIGGLDGVGAGAGVRRYAALLARIGTPAAAIGLPPPHFELANDVGLADEVALANPGDGGSPLAAWTTQSLSNPSRASLDGAGLGAGSALGPVAQLQPEGARLAGVDAVATHSDEVVAWTDLTRTPKNGLAVAVRRYAVRSGTGPVSAPLVFDRQGGGGLVRVASSPAAAFAVWGSAHGVRLAILRDG